MRIAITGSSGLIGTALGERLRSDGHEVVGVVRREASGAHEVRWDPSAGTIDAAGLVGVDAVVNLAGAGIGDHRWTDEYKREVHDSRTDGTSLLARTIAELDGGPRVLLNGSAIGYYGDRGDEELDETSASGDDFLSDVCRDWEAAAAPAADAGVRVAYLRTGIVLTPDGGALAKMLPLFKLGLGGRFGSGRQWMSWISLPDEIAAIVHLLMADVSGPVNLTAPSPVRNAEFADALGDVLKRPSFLPVPSFGPKLLVGAELAEALLFSSQRVRPDVLTVGGFAFAHTDVRSALRAVLDR